MFAVEELGWTELVVNQPVFEIGSSSTSRKHWIRLPA